MAAILAVLLIACGILVASSVRTAQASIYTGTVLQNASTTASFSITTSTRILATTTTDVVNGGRWTRVYSTICNPNANPVYISMNNDVPATLGTSTYVIAAAAGYSACYEITDRNMYQGSIQASSTNQTATTIFVSDYFQ